MPLPLCVPTAQLENFAADQVGWKGGWHSPLPKPTHGGRQDPSPKTRSYDIVGAMTHIFLALQRSADGINKYHFEAALPCVDLGRVACKLTV